MEIKDFTSNKVKEIREEKLISRSELAQMSSLSISTINRIEQGKAQPSLTTMRKILNALGVPRERKEMVFPIMQ
ncbi:helix-turn-helix transcriptional regulator [bacterium]|nr:helix-turn-helix transcriptional regulator [bacterium]MBU1614557.1 helix-turn-helix transcriptional regulator [bacterium]